MPSVERDSGFDALLDLDDQILVVDPDGGYWVKFVVHQVPVTPERPHGLDFSLTLHDRDGRLKLVKPNDYTDAATLLTDFWADVDAMLREKGVIR